MQWLSQSAGWYRRVDAADTHAHIHARTHTHHTHTRTHMYTHSRMHTHIHTHTHTHTHTHIHTLPSLLSLTLLQPIQRHSGASDQAAVVCPMWRHGQGSHKGELQQRWGRGEEEGPTYLLFVTTRAEIYCTCFVQTGYLQICVY